MRDSHRLGETERLTETVRDSQRLGRLTETGETERLTET